MADRPFTRRGVLSLVNSVFDPLGLAAPVLLEGRLLLQELVVISMNTTATAPQGWDNPLPEGPANRWRTWRDALPDLEKVHVRQCYHPREFGPITRAEIHAFSDARQRAIGVAVYLRLFNDRQEVAVSLVFGQAKVVPINPVSIPHLELCGSSSRRQSCKVVGSIGSGVLHRLEGCTWLYLQRKQEILCICRKPRRDHTQDI